MATQLQPLWSERDPGAAQRRRVMDAVAKGCHKCPARDSACQPVIGKGPTPADVMVVGRQPGPEEDLENTPWFGPDGLLLRKWLTGAGLKPEDTYLTNSMMCHTLDRKPTNEEYRACFSWNLRHYIHIIAPVLVITVGAEASKFIGGIEKLSKDHGFVFRHDVGCYVIGVYQPGAVRHNYEMRHAIAYDQAQVARFVEEIDRHKLALLVPDGQ